MRTRIFRNILFAAVLALCSPILLPSQNVIDIAKELANAAQSPYDVERFVETHGVFSWDPLWDALKIADGPLSWYCSLRLDAAHDCSSELIEVAAAPQAILILRGEFDQEAYLRYLQEMRPDGTIGWRFAGHYEPTVKYFVPTHRIVMFGKTPYFAFTEQGASGSGVSTTSESWIDLTQPKFKPVFSYTKEGSVLVGRIRQEFTGQVVEMREKPKESITVSNSESFFGETTDGSGEVALGGRRDNKEVYIRAANGEFVGNTKMSTPSPEEDEDFDWALEVPCEVVLREDLASLKEIAADKAQRRTREWLQGYLSDCKDTPEKKQLAGMLRATRRGESVTPQSPKPRANSSGKKP
jgi:hypothetical protein